MSLLPTEPFPTCYPRLASLFISPVKETCINRPLSSSRTKLTNSKRSTTGLLRLEHDIQSPFSYYKLPLNAEGSSESLPPA
ncbi:hypothetical protein PCANC_03933 [Puccinia coronata f. sp. avenae]|uniref:Uncharacterized protein n=1 Tax=Puccinia coronata f. sp. avenae TaxID=200324 RepID=A0A2N5W1A5_9BASI|nr:hypothetical protein PCANC_03933 [Puccinia coronata f. sp. avenae]